MWGITKWLKAEATELIIHVDKLVKNNPAFPTLCHVLGGKKFCALAKEIGRILAGCNFENILPSMVKINKVGREVGMLKMRYGLTSEMLMSVFLLATEAESGHVTCQISQAVKTVTHSRLGKCGTVVDDADGRSLRGRSGCGGATRPGGWAAVLVQLHKPTIRRSQ